ncbi:MAG: hypothetical protein H0V18_16130 [Pyrinomonadaceae bacterium]|nr:hypothetical protein [Pyrinomonadaceae bacterium]
MGARRNLYAEVSLINPLMTGARVRMKLHRSCCNLRDRAFQASDERLALALGRPIEEVTAWNAGQEVIDDDVVMKARGIAMNRGVRIE